MKRGIDVRSALLRQWRVCFDPLRAVGEDHRGHAASGLRKRWSIPHAAEAGKDVFDLRMRCKCSDVAKRFLLTGQANEKAYLTRCCLRLVRKRNVYRLRLRPRDEQSATGLIVHVTVRNRDRYGRQHSTLLHE